MTRRLLTLFLIGAAVLCGCSGDDAERTAKTVTVTRTVERAAETPVVAKRSRSTEPRRDVAYVRCDQNIRARARTTTCGFASNAFYEYWRSDQAATIWVHSPTTGRTYRTRCSSDGDWVRCRTDDGGIAKFRQRAVDVYDEDQAAAYRSSHDTGRASGTGSSPGGGYDDDGYDDSGTYDDYGDSGDPSAASDFCDTHDCIPNYPNGRGDTVQCADGSYSQSGGIQGACSHHGGVSP